MKIKTNVGKNRKAMADALASLTGAEKKYLGVPSCAYQVGVFTIDREGSIECPDETDTAELMAMLSEHGWVEAKSEPPAAAETPSEKPEPPAAVETPSEKPEPPAAAETPSEKPEPPAAAETPSEKPEPPEAAESPSEKLEPPAVESFSGTISFPRSRVTEHGLENLDRILDSKGVLMAHAFGLEGEGLTYTLDADRISFPWFMVEEPENMAAYADFLEHLLAFAEKSKRITAKPRAVENEKYAFRCFLLRLGFVGKEWKPDRHILLGRLSGSSAFKHGRPAREVNADA